MACLASLAHQLPQSTNSRLPCKLYAEHAQTIYVLTICMLPCLYAPSFLRVCTTVSRMDAEMLVTVSLLGLLLRVYHLVL